MINRRRFLAGSAAGAATATALASCAPTPEPGPHVVRYWGIGAADKDKDEAVLAAFRKTDAGKDAEVHIDQVPSNGVSDLSQIITAVRGGTAPDLWWMDRFNTVQTASIGLLEPLDQLVEKYEQTSVEEFTKQWIQFSVDEVTYDGKLYGLPTGTDARGLMYNEDVLRDAGVDLDLFDPQKHVLTWDELHEAALRITTTDSRGNYERLGFAPWKDEGWPYTWGFGLGAEAYDEETARVTLDSPAWDSVYDVYARWADDFPYSHVDAFFATYQPPNAPPSQTAMFSGHLGITTTGPWSIGANEKYAKDLPLKFTWLPVAKEGDDTYTWSGGSSLGIPKGAHITRTLWEFMKFHAGYKGQSIVQPKIGSLPTHLKALEDHRYRAQAEMFARMLPNSIARPPLPAGQAIWDTMARTQSAVALGASTPTEATETNQKYVEPKMDLFPGYEMPETYGEPSRG
jgi:multiple sugar transport system substrate-binding protein